MSICHYNKVDLENIIHDFTIDELHRSSLIIPLLERDSDETICIIGQNPSNANKFVADKTLHYLERYIFEIMPQYSKIIMLNLYSRVDTKKEYETDLLRLETERKLRKFIRDNSDFLIVFGKSKKQGAYQFIKKAKNIKKLLASKNVFKIDIDTIYPPHPGNRQIYYGNYCHNTTNYDFSDI